MLHRGFSRCWSRPWAGACHTVSLAQPPRLLSPALLPPGIVATTASASGKGEVVLKPEGWSCQRPAPGCPRSPGSCPSPLSFLPYAALLLLRAGAPSCPTLSCLQGWLLPRAPFPTACPVRAPACPAQVSPSSARPSACRRRRAELAGSWQPRAGSRAVHRTLPRALTGSGVCYSWPCPALGDRSCFEGKSCRSGLGLLGACGAGGRDSRAGPPWFLLWEPPQPRTAAEREAPPLPPGHARSSAV